MQTKFEATTKSYMLAERFNKALAAGEISNVEYAELQADLAKAMFPEDPRTALSKFFASSVGREMLANAQQPPTSEMFETYQKRHGYGPQGSGHWRGAAGSGVGVNQAQNPYTSTNYSASAANSDDPVDLSKATVEAYAKEHRVTVERARDELATAYGRRMAAKASQRAEQF